MGTKDYRNNAFTLVSERRKGFTLVELMIVIAVLAILATISIMFMRGQQFKGNDARRKADIDRIKIAVEEYEKDHNCYPQYVICGIHPDQPIYPYLNNVPCDPTTGTSYLYDPQGSTQCPDWYRFYSNFQFTADPVLTPKIGPNYAFNYVTGSANAPVSAPGGSSGGPTPTPGTGGGESSGSGYYGCRSGVCVPINWNPVRPGPECDPSFQDINCYRQCGPSGLECVAVN